MKDSLFLNYLDEVKIVDGLIDFIKNIKNQGHAISIVTNCNSTVAKSIIKHIGIERYIDFVTCANDTMRPKPYSDPYVYTMKKYYDKQANECVIFEDSQTGILSASGVNPLHVVGLSTFYDENTLKAFGADIVFDSFINKDIQQCLSTCTPPKILAEYIKSTILKD